MILLDDENSASGGPKYLTVADIPPVPTDNAKSGSPWEPLLSPIVVCAWSHIRLGLVKIDIWVGRTDGRVPNIIYADYKCKFKVDLVIFDFQVSLS